MEGEFYIIGNIDTNNYEGTITGPHTWDEAVEARQWGCGGDDGFIVQRIRQEKP